MSVGGKLLCTRICATLVSTCYTAHFHAGLQMRVAQEAKKAVENVYGTVYTVGSASSILCKLVSGANFSWRLELPNLN